MNSPVSVEVTLMVYNAQNKYIYHIHSMNMLSAVCLSVCLVDYLRLASVDRIVIHSMFGVCLHLLRVTDIFCQSVL